MPLQSKLQLELHVYNPEHKLLSYLSSKGIVPQAYSPLGSSNSPLLTDVVVVQIAAKYSLQPSDVLLGYLRTSPSSAVIGHNEVYLIFSCKANRCASQICHSRSYYIQSYKCRRCRKQVKV